MHYIYCLSNLEYTCIRLYLENFLFAGEGGASLKALERSGEGEEKAWINRR